MNKEEFRKKLIEQTIFEELKDCCISNNYLRKKYQGLDIDHNKVYRRIINYRISKYGSSFITSPDRNIIPKNSEYRKAWKRNSLKKTVAKKYELKKFLERNS